MIRQLLRRGQLTIPVELLKNFDLHEKDFVDVSSSREGILIKPVSITDYSHRDIEKLRKKLDKLPRGEKRVYHSFSESKKHLDLLKEK